MCPGPCQSLGSICIFFWKHLNDGDDRRQFLPANPLPFRVWLWALIAGSLGIVALVLALNILNRFVVFQSRVFRILVKCRDSPCCRCFLLLLQSPLCRRVRFPRIHARTYRASLRVAYRYFDHWNDVLPWFTWTLPRSCGLTK